MKIQGKNNKCQKIINERKINFYNFQVCTFYVFYVPLTNIETTNFYKSNFFIVT